MSTTAAQPSSKSPVTPEHLHQYQEEGYTLVRGLIPPAEMEVAWKMLLNFEAGEHDWPEEYFQFAEPARFRNAKGGKLAFGVQLPSKHSEDFRRIADHANLQAAMASLLGGPVARFTDQCAIKSKIITTPQAGQTFFHQDSYYWHIDPSLGCNCWIPFQEVGRDAIALAVMPGSQKGWKLLEHEQYYDDPPFYGGRSPTPYKRHRIPAAAIDSSKEVLVPMQAGDALFFTNYTWHRSEKNLTGRTMSFYAIAYKRSDK
jgi:ectoine hydroxylase-related dioxygenase (phytanoyl-CoA dioxygenase family)